MRNAEYSKPPLISKVAQKWLGQIDDEPALPGHPTPQPGPQELFMQTDADIALYGGSAGSGKTFALLLDFAREEFLDNPQYGGVIFRRSYPMVRNEGGLWDESSKLFPQMGAIAKESTLEWKFPKGATIRFAHLQHQKNVYDWQGSQLVRIAFDELTHFTETQFWYLLSRNRSVSGIKPQIRATCNPDADSWVAKMVDWWIDEAGFPIADRSGVVRWFVRINGELIWGNSSEELAELHPDAIAKSFTFIAAKIYDNPILLGKDPGYLANLMALHPVERSRLLDGNWRVKYDSGKIFNRAWFEVVDEPIDGREIRFWDLAATAKEVAKSTSFWTVGVKMRRNGNLVCIVDVICEQRSPSDVDTLIVSTAQQDGVDCAVRWELEGGSAGKFYEASMLEKLRKFDAKAIKPMGDKVTRAIPFAAAASRGEVMLLRAPWNDQYLSAVQLFDGTPKPMTNDIVDASDGAYAELMTESPGMAIARRLALLSG